MAATTPKPPADFVVLNLAFVAGKYPDWPHLYTFNVAHAWFLNALRRYGLRLRPSGREKAENLLFGYLVNLQAIAGLRMLVSYEKRERISGSRGCARAKRRRGFGHGHQRTRRRAIEAEVRSQ